MSQARIRRFPPVSGPYGWAGAVLFIAALICELVAVLGLVWAVFNNALGQAAPLVVAFLVSFLLMAAASWLWRQGRKRTGTLAPSSVTAEQRPALLRAGAVVLLGTVLGFGGFVYLAVTLHGSRRLTLGVAALIAGGVISEFGVTRMLAILGRPAPRFLGLSPKRSLIISIAFLLIDGVFVLIGLFWPDLVPMP
jgi:hypothetical protein